MNSKTSPLGKAARVAGVLALLAAQPFAAGIAAAQTAPAPAAQTTVPVTQPAPTEAVPAAGAPVEAAPAAAPDALLNAVEQAEVENPYGLKAMWEHGDFVSRGTLFIMIIMSMGTWYVLVTKMIEQGRILSQAKAAQRDFWTASTLSEGKEKLKETSTFRALVDDGLRAADHHEGTLTEHIDLHSWITMSLQRSVDALNSRMQTGLSFLATVGSTAPFIGLFGTVWGIYHALVAIGVSGQASIDKVAGPVGEALIMTAIGLGVAVPAVLAYNWLVRRNKAAMEKVRTFAADLHAVLIANQAKGRTPVARSA